LFLNQPLSVVLPYYFCRLRLVPYHRSDAHDAENRGTEITRIDALIIVTRTNTVQDAQRRQSTGVWEAQWRHKENGY
jgi:hypothetical protein